MTLPKEQKNLFAKSLSKLDKCNSFHTAMEFSYISTELDRGGRMFQVRAEALWVALGSFAGSVSGCIAGRWELQAELKLRKRGEHSAECPAHPS